jgi:hypothetical protein
MQDKILGENTVNPWLIQPASISALRGRSARRLPPDTAQPLAGRPVVAGLQQCHVPGLGPVRVHPSQVASAKWV